MTLIRNGCLSAIAAACLATTAGLAEAGGFAIREQSAEGLGNAFAGVAAGTDGLSAMFWNPATIGQHNGQGLVIEGNGSAILPYSRANNGTGFLGNPDSGNIGEDALVPSMFMSYGVNDRLTVGLAFSSPFGLSTNSNPWMGSLHGDVSDVQTMNFSPTIAYKLSDWITVGAGVEGEYAKMKLTSSTPTGAEIFRAKTDDFAVGFTAGVLLQPSDNLNIGVGFRSSISHQTDGNGYLIDPTTSSLVYSGKLGVSIDTPETVTIGAAYRANDQLTLKAGAEWANWSRFKKLVVEAPGGIPIGSTTENWKDSWFFSAGADYAATEKLTLRAGLGYETSPVPNATRTPRLPDSDRLWLSAGASYKVNEHLMATLGYSHLFMRDAKVALTSPTPLAATFKNHIDIVSAGATMSW